MAAAVTALLEPDGRFERYPDGRWGLAHETHPNGLPLDRLRYAVVDVETTGGLRWRGHGIVEIAIVQVSDGVLGEAWQTLLDPGRPIPPFVTELTGITQDMVSGAPRFEHVAAAVLERLDGRVFVAHNVGFDWGFVSAHLRGALGQAPCGPRLCTLQLARRLLPRLRRRSLGALAHHFGIPVHARHRALGDALATARILLRLLDDARGRGLGDLTALEAYVGPRKRRGRAGDREGGNPGEARVGEGP
jgi:DNA polymerase-3 subunit epsilon